MAQQLKSAPLESEKRRLHIDDNTSVLNRYSKENEVADFWRARIAFFNWKRTTQGKIAGFGRRSHYAIQD